MNLDDFIITCFCVIDEMMPMITKDHRLQAQGPHPISPAAPCPYHISARDGIVKPGERVTVLAGVAFGGSHRTVGAVEQVGKNYPKRLSAHLVA